MTSRRSVTKVSCRVMGGFLLDIISDTYGRPVPRADALQGVYTDEHLIVGIVPKAKLYDDDANFDMTSLQCSREAYARAGLDRAPKKALKRRRSSRLGKQKCAASQVALVPA